jgi:AcrR family transcriptional regulator
VAQESERRATAPRPLRRDAARNRTELLAAAGRAFAEQGVNTSLEQIARDAGLAIGTLYRHFPSRAELVVAAYDTKIGDFLARKEELLAMGDSWDAFRIYLDTICAMQATDRGFSDFLSMRFPASRSTEDLQDRICLMTNDILDRAQSEGTVRTDVSAGDVVSLIWANSRILDATLAVAPNTWRRHLHLMLSAFRAGDNDPLPEPPLDDQELYDAMTHLGAEPLA